MEPQLYDHKRTLTLLYKGEWMLMQRQQQGTMEEKSAICWRKQGLACESAVTLSQGVSSATTRHASATAIVLPPMC